MSTKIKPNQWYQIKNQSLARYANYAGFDLALYDLYSETAKSELRKRTISEAVFAMCSDTESYFGFDLSEIERGVYVISLSNGLVINYKQKPCDVIYIGRGAITTRLKSHFEGKLFDFMLSLSGANFDFRFAVPEIEACDDGHKHVEFLLLERFQETYGGLGEKNYPLMNKNKGSDMKIDYKAAWWKSPLKMTGKKVRWSLFPLGRDFGTLD